MRKRAGMKSIEDLDVNKEDVDHERLGCGQARIICKRIEDDPIDQCGDLEKFIEADCDCPNNRSNHETQH